MKWLTRLLTLLAFLSVFLTAAFFGLGPQWVDRASNRVVGDPGRAVLAVSTVIGPRQTIYELVGPAEVAHVCFSTNVQTRMFLPANASHP